MGLRAAEIAVLTLCACFWVSIWATVTSGSASWAAVALFLAVVISVLALVGLALDTP